MASSSQGSDAEPNSLPYFFPELKSLPDVVELLSYHIEVNGAFILRTSSSSNTTYTLTVVHNRGVKHIRVQGDLKNGFRLAHRKFERLSKLITYYGNHDVPNVEDVAGVRLTHPVTQHYITGKSPTPRDPPVRKITSPNNYMQNPPTQLRQRESDCPDILGPDTPTSAPMRQRSREFVFPQGKAAPDASTNGSTHKNADIGSNSPNGSHEPCIRKVRPPPPPPIVAPPNPHAPINAPYDYAFNITLDHTNALIQALKLSDRCECGLYSYEAELPKGWTVHLTEKDGQKVFFVSPDQTSHWDLPDHIRVLLQPQHRKVLQKYGAL